VVLRGPKSSRLYPEPLRHVRVIIELDGEAVAMDFLSNNLEWSPASIAGLYRCRGDLDKFFRQIKQSLDLCDFLGNSANAVHWQIWTALLVYVLLRYLAYLSYWPHSFTRLWAILRATLWRKMDLLELIRSYGTAGGEFRFVACPEQAYLPGFAR